MFENTIYDYCQDGLSDSYEYNRENFSDSYEYCSECFSDSYEYCKDCLSDSYEYNKINLFDQLKRKNISRRTIKKIITEMLVMNAPEKFIEMFNELFNESNKRVKKCIVDSFITSTALTDGHGDLFREIIDNGGILAKKFMNNSYVRNFAANIKKFFGCKDISEFLKEKGWRQDKISNINEKII